MRFKTFFALCLVGIGALMTWATPTSAAIHLTASGSLFGGGLIKPNFNFYGIKSYEVILTFDQPVTVDMGVIGDLIDECFDHGVSCGGENIPDQFESEEINAYGDSFTLGFIPPAPYFNGSDYLFWEGADLYIDVNPLGTTNPSIINYQLNLFGSTPEPSSWALAILGVAMTGIALRRRGRTLWPLGPDNAQASHAID